MADQTDPDAINLSRLDPDQSPGDPAHHNPEVSLPTAAEHELGRKGHDQEQPPHAERQHESKEHPSASPTQTEQPVSGRPAAASGPTGSDQEAGSAIDVVNDAGAEPGRIPASKGKEIDVFPPVPPEKAPAVPTSTASRSDSLPVASGVDKAPDTTQPTPDGPVCLITLLLTTGSRHPYKLDERYLLKRNVNVPGTTESGRLDPFSISIYTLKELILREWREEWETKPSSPSSIRLIHFGKLLDDKEPLRQYHFNAEAPNIVHMSVRPQDIADEDEPKGGTKSARDNRRVRGNRCCVIL